MPQWSAGLLPAPENSYPGFKLLEQAVNTRPSYDPFTGELGVTDPTYPIGNVCRYGADPTGLRPSAVAFTAAIAGVRGLYGKGGVVTGPAGRYVIESNIVVSPDFTAFDGGYCDLSFPPGTKLLPTSAVTECLSFRGPCAQEAWIGCEGLTVDLTNAGVSTLGLVIHTQNVKVRRTTIKYGKTDGIKYVYHVGEAPPICSELDAVSLLYNDGIGINCPAPAAGLWMHGCRVEGSGSEGALFDNAGHLDLNGNVIEMNGRLDTTAAELRVRNSVDGLIDGNYFESIAYQNHQNVIIEGNTSAPSGLTITGNRFVGYYETFSGSGVPLANAVGLDIAGGAGGAVETVVAFGNYYFGMAIGVRINTNARGYFIGPDNFSNNFDPAFVTPACTRYSRLSTQPGVVYDLSRYASTVYNIGQNTPGIFTTVDASGVITAAAGIKYTGGVTVAGSTVKSATLGLLHRAVAGSTADYTVVDPSGNAVYEVPTGTQDSQFFGSTIAKTTTIVYAASMTPNADAGDIQKITATNNTPFTIAAPSNPRQGQRLWIRLRNISGGALGAITPDVIYKLAGGAWPSPLNGFSRVLCVDYDGTNWVESFRTPTDIPN